MYFVYPLLTKYVKLATMPISCNERVMNEFVSILLSETYHNSSRHFEV